MSIKNQLFMHGEQLRSSSFGTEGDQRGISQACGKSATWCGPGGAVSAWPPRAGAIVNGELLPLFPSLASIGRYWYESCAKLWRIRAAGPDGAPRILAVDALRDGC